MKFKTTKKEIMANYPRVISVGYCALQNLLAYETPVAYTANQYGWRADLYDFGAGAVIVTGYSPFGNYRPSYDVCRKYDAMAENKTGAERENILAKFITEVCA